MVDMGIEPELIFTAQPKIFVNQLVTVFIITLIVSLYPLINVIRLKEINYLRD